MACDNCLERQPTLPNRMHATDTEGMAMRQRDEIARALKAHGSAVWRMCILHLQSRADAEDAYQETFLRYATADATAFNDSEHEKAWLLRVASNVCIDMNKAARNRNLSLDAMETQPEIASADALDTPESFSNDVIRAFQSLPDPPKTALYLSTYEGYTAPEIAELLDMPVNTVYSWISRGRKLLQEVLS